MPDYIIEKSVPHAKGASVTVKFPLQDLLKTLIPYNESKKTYDTKYQALSEQSEISDNDRRELKELEQDRQKKMLAFRESKKTLRGLFNSSFNMGEFKEKILAEIKESCGESNPLEAILKGCVEVISSSEKDGDPTINIKYEQLPLNIQVMFQKIGLDEIFKNSIDALLDKHLLATSSDERMKLPETAEITIDLSVENQQCRLTIVDNGGGFPEKHLVETKRKLSEREQDTRVRWLTDADTKSTESSKRNKARIEEPRAFGGHGIGLKLIFGWMLDGIVVEGKGQYKHEYDFSHRPLTEVVLKNTDKSSDIMGACIELTAPVQALLTLLDQETIQIQSRQESLSDSGSDIGMDFSGRSPSSTASSSSHCSDAYQVPYSERQSPTPSVLTPNITEIPGNLGKSIVVSPGAQMNEKVGGMDKPSQEIYQEKNTSLFFNKSSGNTEQLQPKTKQTPTTPLPSDGGNSPVLSNPSSPASSKDDTGQGLTKK